MTTKNLSPKSLAAKIRTLQGKRTLTELSEEAGISKSTLSRLINGKYPDIETFRQLCIVLKADANDLLELL